MLVYGAVDPYGDYDSKRFSAAVRVPSHQTYTKTFTRVGCHLYIMFGNAAESICGAAGC